MMRIARARHVAAGYWRGSTAHPIAALLSAVAKAQAAKPTHSQGWVWPSTTGANTATKETLRTRRPCRHR